MVAQSRQRRSLASSPRSGSFCRVQPCCYPPRLEFSSVSKSRDAAPTRSFAVTIPDVRFTPESRHTRCKCPLWAKSGCLPQFEYTSHHWHACAANLGRGHPASTLVRTCHEPARSSHFDALTHRLCKAQVRLGVQVRE